ncbi:HNH endonuclease [Roseivirga ehrenbergii]|uniref:HNH nuclease domain-containing protein n=1 Tax=Roseivirga ehrenbergii (strain DSM 102268 / JCM 13514 / KCTC 12282 / NCIMB 14502 / KMM 6017) TaxID=279360 RepID=A0A150X0H0_ROSEK|nr:HNH endonuclease signature motif containing protein [Roseivirga ehrenbergii]KYG72176.1 hypothetical protein MB14_09020 [Roseivirga ehrenbergii]TCL13410.1 HNH endonuclease [Roseivirga ehrenbergii]
MSLSAIFHSKIITQVAKQRKSIPQLIKKRSILQKEIESRCPICNSDDPEHFQIHHIDEDPSHNAIGNLILVCPTCHSKITKGDLERSYIELLKSQSSCHRMKFVSVNLSKVCSWKKDSSLDSSFWFDGIDAEKTFNPVLIFTIKNNSNYSELFEGLNLKVDHLPSGLSGIPRTYELKSIGKYTIEIPREGDITSLLFENQIVIPANDYCKVEVEIIDKFQGYVSPIKTRKVLRLVFRFADFEFHIPVIYLNCNSENTAYKIVFLS